MSIDRTSTEEYVALSKLAKSDRRSRAMLTGLLLVLAVLFGLGGWSLYTNQRNADINRNNQAVQLRNDIRRDSENAITASKESVHYNTCISVLEVSERTPAAQRECFRQADLPGGLDEQDFVTVPPDRVVPAPATSSSNQRASSSMPSSTSGQSPSQESSSSSSQPTPPTPQPQPNIIQSILKNVRSIL